MVQDSIRYDAQALPSAYADTGAKFAIKSHAENFRVTEILGFEPSGKGDHLFLFIEKKNRTTAYVREQLAQAFHVPPVAVGYSGLKDKNAITQQWFSIKSEKSFFENRDKFESYDDHNDAYCKLISESRNSKKLKIGTHKLNHFSIVLENVSHAYAKIDENGLPVTQELAKNDHLAQAINKQLEQIKINGVPNYFGPQRFGFLGANIQKSLDFFDGKIKPSKEKSSIYISAARSFLFNELLAYRVHQNSWREYTKKDKLILSGSNSFFTIDSNDDVAKRDVCSRLLENDIAVAGELFSSLEEIGGDFRNNCLTQQNYNTKMWLEDNTFDAKQALIGRLQQGLSNLNLRPSLRPLSILPQNVDCLMKRAPNKVDIRLSFELPAGAYATAVLKELGSF